MNTNENLVTRGKVQDSNDEMIKDVIEYSSDGDAAKIEEFLDSCLKFLNQKFSNDQMMSLQFIQTIVKIHDGKYRIDNQEIMKDASAHLKSLRKNVNMFLSIYDPMILEKLLDQFELNANEHSAKTDEISKTPEYFTFELVLKINMYTKFLEQSIGETFSDAISSYDQLVATNINFNDYTEQLVKYFKMVDAYGRFYNTCDNYSNLFLDNIHSKNKADGKARVESMKENGLELLRVSKDTWAAMHRMCVDNLINMMIDKTDKLA